MHLLLPSPAERPWAASLDDDALAALYGYPRGVTAERPWVRANFVSTLDGAATGADGRSGSINTGADREVFALLRALADVVVVGAGTARAEGYRRVVTRAKWRDRRAAAGQTAHPAVAVVCARRGREGACSDARWNGGLSARPWPPDFRGQSGR